MLDNFWLESFPHFRGEVENYKLQCTELKKTVFGIIYIKKPVYETRSMKDKRNYIENFNFWTRMIKFQGFSLNFYNRA